MNDTKYYFYIYLHKLIYIFSRYYILITIQNESAKVCKHPFSVLNNNRLQWRFVWFMVFNATINNISSISWRVVLSMGETEVPGENHWPVVSHLITQCCIVWVGFELTTLVVIGTDCIGNCKSNYHKITVTTAPNPKRVCKKCASIFSASLTTIGDSDRDIIRIAYFTMYNPVRHPTLINHSIKD